MGSDLRVGTPATTATNRPHQCPSANPADGCQDERLCPQAGHLGVSSARGGPVGEPLVDDVAGLADGVRPQPESLWECAVGAPSTQRSSADADAV